MVPRRNAHALAAQPDPLLPRAVRPRTTLYDDAKYEEALAAFRSQNA
jgi:hypothetical protein